MSGTTWYVATTTPGQENYVFQDGGDERFPEGTYVRRFSDEWPAEAAIAEFFRQVTEAGAESASLHFSA